jgi:hypothetical protein
MDEQQCWGALKEAKFSNQKRLQQLAGAYLRPFKLQLTLWIRNSH